METAVTASDGTFGNFITNLRQLVPAITNVFDSVLVMDEETAVLQSPLQTK